MIWTTEIINFLYGKSILSNLKETPFLSTNSACRKPSIVFQMTDEETFEYCKCKTDIIYFAENYCILYDNNLQMNAPILLTDTQKSVLKCTDNLSLHESDRQVGMSTIYAIMVLHACTFNSNYYVALTDANIQCSIEQLNKIKNFYMELPFFLKAGVVNINNHYLNFDNYSKIKIGSSKNMLVGFNANLHITQSVEHYSKSAFNDLIRCIIPTTTCIKNSKMIIQHCRESYLKQNIDYASWSNSIKHGNTCIAYLPCHNSRVNKPLHLNNLEMNVKDIACNLLKNVMKHTKLTARELRNMIKES